MRKAPDQRYYFFSSSSENPSVSQNLDFRSLNGGRITSDRSRLELGLE